MDKIYFDIPVELKNPLEEKIAEAFQVYDHNNVNMIDGRDVGAVLRSLGCVPSENEIEAIVKATEFPGPSRSRSFIKFYAAFEDNAL